MTNAWKEGPYICRVKRPLSAQDAVADRFGIESAAIHPPEQALAAS